MVAKKKHIIITKIFNFGGSNAHLKNLIKYLGETNIVLIVSSNDEINLYQKVIGLKQVELRSLEIPLNYALFNHKRLTNVREFIKLLYSLWLVARIGFKYRSQYISVCSVEPEKHLYLLWLKPFKVFYILHSSPPAQLSPFTRITCNLNLSSRKQIITVSEANKKSICRAWSIRRDKHQYVRSIYNCVNHHSIASNCEITANALEPKLVFTFGHVIDYKNPFTWLKVALYVTSKDASIEFKWIGDGPLLSLMRERTTRYDNINFVGYQEAPYRYFSSNSIYYQPSLYETNGIAVIEAMANKRPCIVSNIGGLPESIEDQISGILIDPLNVEEQSEAILSLFKNPDLAKRLGNNAFEKYKQQYTFESFRTEMDKIYFA